MVRAADLGSPASLTRGRTDHLAVTLALPESADDAFADQQSQLALTSTATQRAGSER